MRVINSYFFDSCLRNIHGRCNLFLHIRHSTGVWAP